MCPRCRTTPSEKNGYCRTCTAEYQRKYRADHPADHARWQRERRLADPEKFRKRDKAYKAEKQERLNAVKLQSGCVDCGFNGHPQALQFDHIDPVNKIRGVSEIR